MGKSKDPEYLTPAEAAALSGMTDSTLRLRADKGKIRFIRTPGQGKGAGHRRYLRSDVEAQVLPRNGRRQAERTRRGRGRGGIVAKRREQK